MTAERDTSGLNESCGVCGTPTASRFTAYTCNRCLATALAMRIDSPNQPKRGWFGDRKLITTGTVPSPI